MEHIADYVTLAVAVHGVALVVVNLTPTPKDNEALGDVARMAVKVYRAVEILAGIISKRAKN
jgi:heme exporter protein D